MSKDSKTKNTNEKNRESAHNNQQNEQAEELLNDLQRTRADFENYRKRTESEKVAAKELGRKKAILDILPIIDTIERATANIPTEIAQNQWVIGIAGVSKQLDRQLSSMGLRRIQATPGQSFDPEIHQAVQFDDESDGDEEIIAEELRAGYILDGNVIRDAMVKVTRK